MDISEKIHSELGASASHRWFNCLGSVALQEGIPGGDSDASRLGTSAHGLGELCLKSGRDAASYIGVKIEGSVVDFEMAEAVQVYLDTVRSYVTPESTLLIETKVCIDWVDERLFGTNDAAILRPDMIVVIDYKHGQGVEVDAEENEQLLYYALGIAKEYAGMDILCGIVQPRFYGAPPVKFWRVSYERLMEFERKLREKVSQVDEATKAIKLGEDPFFYTKAGDHCKFCRAEKFCETRRADALSVASMDFDKVLKPKIVKSLTPEEMSKALSLMPRLEDWISAVRNHCMDYVKAGGKIPGFKAVPKRPSKKWKDPEVVGAYYEPLFGEEIYAERKLRTPAQLEKIIGKSVKQFYTSESSGYNLASEKDDRKEVLPYADHFDHIE